MEKMNLEYRYRIREDRESPHDSGYDYRVVIEARQRAGEWRYVDSFHTLAYYDGAVDDAEAQIEWLSSRKIYIAD